MTDTTDQSTDPGMMKRRTIVHGAAWSIPAVSVAAAAPFAAASTPCPSGSQSFGIGATTFALPACVRQITYEVVAGNGGGGNGTAVGQGARLTGTIAVAAGTTLQIVVGAGGTQVTGGIGIGGAGYGNGGNGGDVTGSTRLSRGGGGGSAILIGASPIVVAGGGGGRPATNAVSGAYGWSPQIPLTAPQGSVPIGNASASGATPNGIGLGANYTNRTGTTFPIPVMPGAGLGATGSTGAAASPALGYNTQPALLAIIQSVVGGAGGNNGTGANGGGNGGSGIFVNNVGLFAASGGGGGGYAGGSSGSGIAVRPNEPIVYDGAFATGGGAGSSYEGPGVTSSSIAPRGESNAATGIGLDGRIVISW